MLYKIWLGICAAAALICLLYQAPILLAIAVVIAAFSTIVTHYEL
jgi:hypothetical protein